MSLKYNRLAKSGISKAHNKNYASVNNNLTLAEQIVQSEQSTQNTVSVRGRA